MAKKRSVSNEYRELCSNIQNMGELASALEGVMEASSKMLNDIYAVMKGASKYRQEALRAVS